MGILFQANDLPLTVIPVGVENGPAYLQEYLITKGLRSVVTASLPYSNAANNACDCPYRIDGECRCCEVVLIVYGANEPPLTLILQCRGPWTCVYLCRSSINQDNQAVKQRLIDLFVAVENNEPADLV